MNEEFKFSLNDSSNQDSSTVDPPSSQLELHAAPGTDLWRKPPIDSFNAPSITTCIKARSFKSAHVTVSADWTRLYDQGGLVLIWPRTGDAVGSGKPLKCSPFSSLPEHSNREVSSGMDQNWHRIL
jgi:Protein of unknown function (DUF1349)